MPRSLAPSPTAIASSGGDAELCGDLVERIDLGLLAEDRFGDDAGQDAVFFEQDVGAVFVEAERGGDAAGEDGEAAGDERGVVALCLHGGDQFRAARRQRDALCDDLVDDARSAGP